jgi:citrate lyase subunit beta/citryl-CoA lyase
MLGKIASLEPDAFIVDFEDGVPPDRKQLARDNLRASPWSRCDAGSRPPVFVRINDLESQLWLEDVRAALETPIAGLVIPKFESFDRLADVDREATACEGRAGHRDGRTRLILQIESMKGFRELFASGDPPASRRLLGLALGAEDFASTLSTFSAIDSDTIDFSRRLLLLHARSMGVLCIDTIHADIKDLGGLAEQSLRIARMGFDGKLAIHPDQIEVINSRLSPSPEDAARARNVLEHRAEIEERGAIEAGGQMIDRAHLNWALKVERHWPEEVRGR